MKKVLALMLTLILVVGILAACKQNDEPAVWKDDTIGQGFRVGFARVDITNRVPVPMAGFGNTSERVSASIGTRLYANCIAVTTADEQTVFFVDVDYQRAYGSRLTVVEQWIEERLGIPGQNLIVTATHTHAAGDLFNKTAGDCVEDTARVYQEGVYESCVEALADRKPAEAYLGSIDTERMNFVKHYKYVDADGNTQYFGDNFGTAVYDGTTTHATEADPTMYIVQFKREGEKDIIMANWRAHAHFGTSASSRVISSDYPGAFQTAMEAKYDCHFAYFEGFAGNMNATTRLSYERRTTDMAQYGSILADYAIDCINKNMKKVETGKLVLKQDTLDMPYNHTTDHLLMAAKNVQQIWTQTNNQEAAKAAGKEFGIRSPYHAGSIISRANAGATTPVELTTVSFSPEFAIGTCVGEPFDTLGEYVEARSPYPTTMCFGYTNGEDGYMPSAIGWEYTSYESDCSKLCPGSGEEVMDHMISMLNEIKAAQ